MASDIIIIFHVCLMHYWEKEKVALYLTSRYVFYYYCCVGLIVRFHNNPSYTTSRLHRKNYVCVQFRQYEYIKKFSFFHMVARIKWGAIIECSNSLNGWSLFCIETVGRAGRYGFCGKAESRLAITICGFKHYLVAVSSFIWAYYYYYW